jgi:REP element-mobilizing transposase RayT
MPFFVTLTVVGWIDVFTRDVYSKEIIKNLSFCQQNRGLGIVAYVLMPSHLHMVCRRKPKLDSFLIYCVTLIGLAFKSYTEEAFSNENLKALSYILQFLLRKSSHCPV